MISARVHYATLALVELAVRRDAACPVTAQQISARCEIPGPFLVQILRSLRAAGWVQSVRGSQGGYRLTVAPEELTLLKIAEWVGGGEPKPSFELGESEPGHHLSEIYGRADQASRAVLARHTIADLADRCRNSDAVMFYI